MYCIPKKKQIRHEKKASLCCRQNLSSVSNVCKAPNSTNYWKCVSKICLHPDRQINKRFFNRPIIVCTQILVHRRGPGTRILTLFRRHSNQSLVLSLAQARENLQINSNGICPFVVILPKFSGCYHRLSKFDRMFT